MEEWFADFAAILERLTDAASHYGALALGWTIEAAQKPGIVALATILGIFGGLVLLLQLTGVLKGDRKVLQRIDESVAALKERYAVELAGKDEEIAALNAALAAVRTSVVEGTERPATVEQALAELQRTGDPGKVEAVLADIEAQAMRAASPHLKEAAAAARHLGALASLRNVEDALAAYRRAAELQPNDTWTWIFISRLERAAGRLGAAEEAATTALACARRQASVRDENAALMELGDLAIAAGRLPDAVRHFEAIRPLFEQQAAADPGNAAWQRDLSVSWDRIGDVRRAQGDLTGALDAYEASHAIAEQFAAADPANAAWQRDLAVSWGMIGIVRQAQGDLTSALDAYEAGKVIFHKLAEADPGNAEWQRDLSISWEKIGDVRRAQGDLAGALDAYEASHAIAETLAAADPTNAQWQRDLSVSWERLAIIHEQQGEGPNASAAWREALAISEALAARFPDSVDLQTTPVVHLAGLARLADVTTAEGRASARGYLERALALLQPLAAAGKLDTQRAGWVEVIEGELAKLDD